MLAILTGETFDVARSAFPASIALNAASATSYFPDPVEPVRETTRAISVGDLLDLFLDAHGNKSDRWKLEIRTSYRVLSELKGRNTDANSLTKQDFRNTLAFIRRMPRQIGNKKKLWGEKSLQQIVAEVEKTSPV